MQTGKAWKYGTENLPIGDKTETHFTNKGKSTDFFEKRLYKLQNRWYYNITPRALRQKQSDAGLRNSFRKLARAIVQKGCLAAVHRKVRRKSIFLRL